MCTRVTHARFSCKAAATAQGISCTKFTCRDIDSAEVMILGLFYEQLNLSATHSVTEYYYLAMLNMHDYGNL